jgi:hypothetical protein
MHPNPPTGRLIAPMHPLEPSGRPLTKLEDAGPRQLQTVFDPTTLESQQQRLPSTLPA